MGKSGDGVIRIIIDAIENAEPAPPVTHPQVTSPTDANGVRLRGTERDTGLPPGCPVEPIGINGDDFYFLDAQRQFRKVRDRDLTRPKINSLFAGRTDYLTIHWQGPTLRAMPTGYAMTTRRGTL